jgi:hypothetical protein
MSSLRHRLRDRCVMRKKTNDLHGSLAPAPRSPAALRGLSQRQDLICLPPALGKPIEHLFGGPECHSARLGKHQAGRTVKVPPQTLHLPRRSKIQPCRPSFASLRRRPRPMMALWPQAGHCCGNHSASYPPGLHPSPRNGTKTITGAKASPRNRYPPTHMTPRRRLRS